MSKCVSKIEKCANCLGLLRCSSDECECYADQKFKINYFTLKIVIEENLIASEKDILINKPNQVINNQKTIHDSIDCLISDKIAKFTKSIRSLEEALIGLESRQTNLDNMLSSSQGLTSKIESINFILNRMKINLETFNSESNRSNLKNLFKT